MKKCGKDKTMKVTVGKGKKVVEILPALMEFTGPSEKVYGRIRCLKKFNQAIVDHFGNAAPTKEEIRGWVVENASDLIEECQPERAE